MEKSDRELIMKCIASNIELKRLYSQHLALEKKLSKLSNRTFLTASEEMETKDLKKKKLRGVDKMMTLISPHRPQFTVRELSRDLSQEARS